MEAIVCTQCCANDWKYENGFRICNFCGTKFALTQEEKGSSTSNISLNSDVDVLLQKCKMDPGNARKYANLVLDIDPTNNDALKILGVR